MSAFTTIALSAVSFALVQIVVFVVMLATFDRRERRAQKALKDAGWARPAWFKNSASAPKR